MPHAEASHRGTTDLPHQAIIKESEGHRAFGELLKRTYCSDEHLIVERDGFPVAVLMSYQEYEKLTRSQAMAALDQFGRDVGREADRQKLTEDQLFREINKSNRTSSRRGMASDPR
jgi:prevent-host-death family protein